MTSTSDALAERATWIRDQLDSLPAITNVTPAAGSDWIAARTRRAQALDALADRLRGLPDRPVLTEDGRGARVRMLGITSTSTEGLAGALRSWLTRAEALSCTPRG